MICMICVLALCMLGDKREGLCDMCKLSLIFWKQYIAGAMPAREARAPLEKCARYACYWEVSTAA